jgi:hypothetical protein
MRLSKTSISVITAIAIVLMAGIFIVTVMMGRVLLGRLFHVQSAPVTPTPGWIWEPNSRTLDRVPPMFLLRPTQFPTNFVPFNMFGKDRYLARRKTVKELLAVVYSQKDSAAELRFLAPLPDKKFDCIIVTPPGGSWWQLLESNLDQQFDLVTQPEFQEGKTIYVVKKRINL